METLPIAFVAKRQETLSKVIKTWLHKENIPSVFNAYQLLDRPAYGPYYPPASHSKICNDDNLVFSGNLTFAGVAACLVTNPLPQFQRRGSPV